MPQNWGMLLTIDLTALSPKVESLIRHAGAHIIMPHFQRLTPDQISEKKSPTDLVTVVDELVETFLSTTLKELLPESIVVGEEGCHRNPGLMQELPTAKWVWLIDPLDGTNNFIQHSDEFGIIVSLIHHGHPVAAWIYLPVYDIMLTGNEENGLLRNGHKIKIPFKKTSKISEMRGLTRTRDKIIHERLKLVAHKTDTHCSAYDFNLLLSGEADFIVYGGSNPWDVVAGSFLLELVGGRAGKSDGIPLMGKALPRNDQPYLATRYLADWPPLAIVIFPEFNQ